MCIHEDVRKIKSNTMKTIECKKLVQKKACVYHSRVETASMNVDFKHTVRDIEDLVLYGTQKSACPYYLTRENVSEADIIFMPYNYVLDPQMRQAQGIDLRNSIVIFDEAHNLVFLTYKRKVCAVKYLLSISLFRKLMLH